MKRQFLISVALLCIFLIVGLAFAQSPQWKGKIEYEDGIKIVKNPREPLYGTEAFRLEEDLTIGVAEGDDEYSFIRLWYLAIDDNQNIYAMDQGATQVKVYDKDGKFLRSIGRKGEGPGELQYPNMIFITDQGQLIVEDFIRNLTYYTLSGDFIRSVTTKSRWPVEIGVYPNGQIFAVTNEPSPDKHGKNIGLYNKDLGLITKISHIPEPKPDPGIIRLFQPSINWAITTDNELVLSSRENYEIDTYDEKGTLLQKIVKEYKPIRITQEDIDNKVCDPQGRKIEAPRNYPTIQSILSDDEGRIVVKTYAKDVNGDYMYDVFDSEGRFIAQFSLRGRIQVIKNGRLYTINEDEDGYHHIKCYEATWRY